MLPDTAVRPCSSRGGTHSVGGGRGDTLWASHSLSGGGCARQGEGTLCRWCLSAAGGRGWVGIKGSGALVPVAHTGQLGQGERG